MALRKGTLALLLLVAGLVLACLLFPTAKLFLARTVLQRTYETIEDPDSFRIVPSSKRLELPTIESSSPRVFLSVDGWRFGLPAQQYRVSPDVGQRFEGDDISIDVRCGFGQEPVIEPGTLEGFPDDLFDLVSAIYRATPDAIPEQEDFESLGRLSALLTMKAYLLVQGMDSLFVEFRRDRFHGFIIGSHPGQSSMTADVYLQDERVVFSLLVSRETPVDLATMKDILGHLDVSEEVEPSGATGHEGK